MERARSLAHDLIDGLTEDYYDAQCEAPDIHVVTRKGRKTQVLVDGKQAHDIYLAEADRLEPPLDTRSISRGALYFCGLLEGWDAHIDRCEELRLLSAQVDMLAMSKEYMDRANRGRVLSDSSNWTKQNETQLARARRLVLEDLQNWDDAVRANTQRS